MRKLLILIITLFTLIFVANEGKTQNLEITNVSVLKNDLGHVIISWEYDGSENLEIHRDSLGINNLSQLHTITNPSITSFIDYTAQAHKKPRSYVVKIETASDIRSDQVSTFYLTFSYDSCLQQINLKWNDLETTAFTANEWTPSKFIINVMEDGVLQPQINVDTSNLEYAVQDILENSNYTFFIETQWDDTDSTSYSNLIEKFTQMPLSPDYINAIFASVEGNNTNLKFEIDPNELNTYKLLKSDSYTGVFDTLETIPTTETEITLTDYNSEPDTKVSYYKLVSVNACGNITDSSNVINNIVLDVEIEDFDVSLEWNRLNEDSYIPVNYDIYRIVSNLEPIYRGSRPTNNPYFNDNIEKEQSYSQFCYFVRGTEEGASESDYSQSNIACVYLKPKVYIPEAFTPNGDDINDLFKPVFNFVPKDYELRIYNRWGNVIFETGDYTKAWNGKEPNGNSAPAGAYIYYLRIKSPNDQIVEERGNITVIYP